jgi:integrase
MVAVLLGCGLRRAELAAVLVEDLQQWEEHWVFADLIGKGGYIRTVPIPGWVAEGMHARGGGSRHYARGPSSG